MQCVSVEALVAAGDPLTFPSGGQSYGMRPVAAVDGKCPVNSFILMAQEDYKPSPFYLTESEAAQIAAATVTLWAIAFGVRMVLRAINQSGVSDHE